MNKSLREKKWKILKPNTKDVLDLLLANRGISSKKKKQEFLNPEQPKDISLSNLGISKVEVRKAITRIKKAISKKEKIIIYGDYDADGICATAILWEALYRLKADVLPYLPERFSEGYGLNSESIEKLKNQYPNLGLIITVDNGIVAFEGVIKANKLGIDIIITDHHQKEKKLPKAFATIHSVDTCGSGLAWLVARQLGIEDGLDLVAIGVIADQVPLIEINRSLVKYGLIELNKTKRLGLLALFNEAQVIKGEINPYTIGFAIAPRLNAMGRMSHPIDSLRLLCTKNYLRAGELSRTLAKANRERQRIVEEVIVHARESIVSTNGVIIVSNESYHEGVIGLAASKLTEEFYRPVIVFSKGLEIAKASARSIPGVNIIAMIRQLDGMLIAGGGHEMAAGFSINSKDLKKFEKELKKVSKKFMTEELLQKTLNIDTEIKFDQINKKFYSEIAKLEPFGMGNPTPTFVSYGLKATGLRTVGKGGKHLKLKLSENSQTFEAIAFGMGEYSEKIAINTTLDVVYSVELDNWNGRSDLQLKVKDFKLRQ